VWSVGNTDNPLYDTLSVKIFSLMLGFECGIPYIYRVIREIDMTQPHITRTWLHYGQSIVLVLFPNGVERVMLRKAFTAMMANGVWTLNHK
jgi:hypothetical protein